MTTQIQQLPRGVWSDTSLAVQIYERYIEATKNILSFQVKLYAKARCNNYYYDTQLKQFIDNDNEPLKRPIDMITIRLSCNGVKSTDYNESGLMKRYQYQGEFSIDIIRSLCTHDFDQFIDHMIKNHLRHLIYTMYDV